MAAIVVAAIVVVAIAVDITADTLPVAVADIAADTVEAM